MSIERYLPERYKESPETLEYSQITGAVLEGLLTQKDELFAQFGIDTATWGLALWEQEYGLPTDLSKPYDYRRSCLRARMRGQGTTTVGMLKNLAESFSNGEVEIEELTGRYKIIIKFVGTAGIPPNMDDFAAAVREVIPAHIEYGFSYTYATHGELEQSSHERLALMTHGQVRKQGAELSEIEDGTVVAELMAAMARTPGYDLPLPAKSDNYSIDIVNEVTNGVDTALMGFDAEVADIHEQLSPSVGKVTPVDNDYLVVDDSADGHKKKRWTFGNFLTWLKGLFYTKKEVDAAVASLNENIGKSIPLNDVSDTAATHRNSFRGKNLGAVVTEAQKAAIRNGSFDDLWLGDYWVIGGKTWRIADFNYWVNCGDTGVPPNHLVIMPDNCLYSHVMNDTNITTGGYVGSKMYTDGLAQAKTLAASAFPNMVLTHRELLVNAVTNGYPSGGSWYDSTVELPNEIMMYGSYVHTPAGNGTIIPYRYTINNSQLALMTACPRFIKTRQVYWLRDVVSAVSFALVDSSGHAYSYPASDPHGVRPVFPVG